MGILSTDDRKWTGKQGAGNAGSPYGSPAVDRWLAHHLSRLYDPVIREPLPPEFIALLAEQVD